MNEQNNEQNNGQNNKQDERNEATPAIIADLEAPTAEEIKGGIRSSAVVSLGKLGRVE